MLPLADPILVFTILMLVILVAPLLAERFRVPDLVLLLGAGALLGPNGLNVLARDAAITLFGSVGLLYIMFIAGLEIDLHRFMRTRNRSIVFGLLTFSVPQGLGMLCGYYLLGFDWPTSILLASMFASHTLLAYPIASRFGIARSEPVVITVGGTIITDTLALLVLAVIADSAKGISLGYGFWIGIFLGMAGLVLLIGYGVPRLTRWFFQNVTEKGGAQFLFVLGVVCGCSYLSHYAKVEPIIGAFLAGAVFNRLIPEHSPLMNRIVFVGNTLFIPFFLISVGMLVNFRTLAGNPRGWLVVVVMVVTVIVSKYAAAWMTRKIFGYSVSGGRVIFGLSVVQAAATLAAVIVGYDLKIFDETVLNGAIAMILVTCPLGAWVVERYGRKMAEQELSRPEPVSTEQRLVVSVANPDSSRRLLDLAFLLRDTAASGGIHPVHIATDLNHTDEAVARGEKLLAGCLAQAASADIPVNPGVRVDLNVSDGVARAAREVRASLVLVGWSGHHGLEGRIFGTVMENLKESCASRLWFCRINLPLNTTRRLLLVMPPLAERRSDLTALLRDVKWLSRQIGADLRVYLAGKDNSALIRQLEAVRPTCPVVFSEAETWSKVQSGLLGEIVPNDMVLLPCERRDSVLWTPGIDRLAAMLAVDFPSMNLLLAFPSLPAGEEETTTEPAAAVTVAAEPEFRSEELRDGIGRDEALRQMVDGAFGTDRHLAGTVQGLLAASMRSYPLELAGETVLFHAHCEGLAAPMLLIGHGRQGWQFNNLTGTYRIILALLSPRGNPPEIHLNTLAALARRFLDPAVAEQVKHAGTAAEICRILKEK